ncbi:MAG: hypothetical protein LLF76_10855 [Planctomycetaceae bacterium]|nr:hypothetical protein [Planctomycetaceae bacterium]
MKLNTLLGIIAAAMTAGCHIIEPVEPPQGHFYLNTYAEVASVSRVVLLELANQSTQPELGDMLTRTLADGLGKKHLFTIRTIYHTDQLWTTLNLDNITSYSYEDLASLQENLPADAVVFGTIKRYTTYPHLLMAVHLKMINLRTGELVWAIEEVWDSTDRDVELRMKRYFATEMRRGYEPLDWELLVTSPRAFNKFVVYEVVSTLPELSGREKNVIPDRREEKYAKTTAEKSMKTAKIN